MSARWHRWLMAEGFLGEVFVTLSSGAFLTGIALALGAGAVSLALLSALPFLAQVGQLVAPALERRLGGRRRFVVPAMAAARVLWLVPVGLAAAGLTGGLAVGLATGAMVAIGLLGMVAANGWTAWVADLVPPADRARLFGRRAWAVAVATLLAAPAGAVLLDHLSRAGRAPVAFGALGAVAAVCGVAGSLALARLPDAPPPPAAPETLRATARRLIAVPRFRRVLGLFGLWNVAVGLAAPFWTLYMLEQLRMSFFEVTLHTVIVLLVRLVVNGSWSRVIERTGSRRVLIACGFGVALVPLFWALPAPGRYWPIWCEAAFSGIVWTGFNQAAFIQPIAALPPADRSRGLAFFNVCTGAALFAAALIGGALLARLGAGARSSFMVLFFATAALRAATALLALRLTEPGRSVRAFFVSFVGDGILRRPSAVRILVPVEVRDGAVERGETDARQAN